MQTNHYRQKQVQFKKKIQWNIENVVLTIKHLQMSRISALNNP